MYVRTYGRACPRTRVCDVSRRRRKKLDRSRTRGVTVSLIFSPIRDEKGADLGDEEAKKKVRQEEERVHHLNLPAIPRLAPAL